MEKKNMKARNDRLDIRGSRLQLTILAQACVASVDINPIKSLLISKKSLN